MMPLAELVAEDWTPGLDAECQAVGCGGCLDELREYPCNCRNCRGLADTVTFNDGELTWWRCEFCLHYFDLDDMEILSGDSQGCEPCVTSWIQRIRCRR